MIGQIVSLMDDAMDCFVWEELVFDRVVDTSVSRASIDLHPGRSCEYAVIIAASWVRHLCLTERHSRGPFLRWTESLNGWSE